MLLDLLSHFCDLGTVDASGANRNSSTASSAKRSATVHTRDKYSFAGLPSVARLSYCANPLCLCRHHDAMMSFLGECATASQAPPVVGTATESFSSLL